MQYATWPSPTGTSQKLGLILSLSFWSTLTRFNSRQMVAFWTQPLHTWTVSLHHSWLICPCFHLLYTSFPCLSSTRSSSFINADFVQLLLHFLHEGMNHSWARRKQADKIRESSWMTSGSSPDSQQKTPQMLSICSRLIFFHLKDSSCLVLMGERD